MKKYAVYCSGGASRILKFYQTYDYIDYPVQFICYDGNDKNIYHKLKSIDLSINVIYIDSNSYNNKEFSNDLLKSLNHFKVDYLFCFGKRILKGDLLKVYKNKIINFHPSILPAFPGLNAIDNALSTSVQLLGNTAHFIDNGIDTGLIISQTVIPRNAFRTFEDVLILQLKMLCDIWKAIENDRLQVVDNVVKFKNNNSNLRLFSYE